MPKTIIEVKTFMCPTGLGNPNALCRFHLIEEGFLKNDTCPNCNLVLVKATDPLDKITQTIIGDEEIEDELDPNTPRPLLHDMPVNTENQKEEYREKRREDISEAIKEAKKLEDKE